MPSQLVLITGPFLEGSDFTVAGRVCSAAEVVLFASDFTSWTYTIWNESQPGTPSIGSGGSAVPADILFSTLQLDGYWDGIDTIGYSMRHNVRASLFNTPHIGGNTYRIEYSMESAAHGSVKAVAVAQCVQMRST